MNQDPKKLLELYKPKQVKIIKPDRQLCMVRFSPCGKVLAAGCQDGTIRRWDASTDQMTDLPALTGHGGWVQAVAFHPDGKRLVTADSWGQVRCWPFADADAKPLWAIPTAHDGWIRRIALSPDGKLLATCGMDRKVRLWSTEDGKQQQEFLGHGQDVYSVAFHPDGKSLVSGDLMGVVKQWDLATGKGVRDFDARILYAYERIQEVGGVRCLAFDATGKTLACAGGQPKSGGFVQGTAAILLFDWEMGKLTHTHKIGGDNDGFVYDLHHHAGGFWMAVTSGQPGTGKFLFQQPGDAQPFFLAPLPNCHSLAVHPNGTRLVVAATNGGSNGNGRLVGKNKDYPGNFSPLHVWEMPKPST